MKPSPRLFRELDSGIFLVVLLVLIVVLVLLLALLLAVLLLRLFAPAVLILLILLLPLMLDFLLDVLFLFSIFSSVRTEINGYCRAKTALTTKARTNKNTKNFIY